MYCDSQSATHLSKNSVFHERTKYIDVRLYFTKDVINDKLVEVKKIAIDINPVDVFTKVVPASNFKEALNLLRLIKK